ncbi:interferon gamma receptor 1 isoform X2 [Ambystoma mexicanum]|uniref:interferon gamma receptor 1 isoform X2 n=1 Tax=Ambystoma mexicanum TaxID=8296 RepID=UPI0037E82031
MWVAERPHLPLLLLGFCCAAVGGAPNTPSILTTVAPPFNLVWDSLNFNTTLRWDYPKTSVTPRFSVEIRLYLDAKTSIVETCRNISEHFCDLSQHVQNPKDYYSGRVKAIVGEEESAFVQSPKFYLSENGKIGPPTLDVSMDGEDVLIEIYHPLTPFTNVTLPDIYEDFTYIVKLDNEEFEVDEEDCYIDACITKVKTPEKGDTQCITARGISKFWAVYGEQSENVCLNVPDMEAKKDYRYRIAMIIVLTFFGITLTFLAALFIWKALQKRNIKLPKSLAFLALNRGSSPTTAERTCVLPVSEQVSPVSLVEHAPLLGLQQPKIPLNDESQIQPVTDVSQNVIENEDPSMPCVNEEPLDEYSTPNNGKANYFQSSASSNDVGSLTANTGPPYPDAGIGTEEELLTVTVSQSFGYDKPHVPLT